MTYRHFCKVFAFVAVMLVLGSHDAHAQKLGDVLTNVLGSWGNVQNVFSTIAWVAGAFLGVAAIFKFKDHVDNPMQHPLSAGVKRMIAGGMFLSLPFTIKAVNGSLFGNAGLGANQAKVDGFNTAALSAGGLDKMVVDVMANIAGPIENLLTAFSYLSAIALMLVGISRLTKRMEEGPRGPAGFGTIMTFIASGMLFNYGSSMGAFTSSMFGDASLMTKVKIDPTVIANAADAGKIQYVLEGLEVFVMIVGYIAFLRGWFVLKSFADGQQGATLAQGLTFLFGGAIAINMGEFVNAITNTVGVTGLTFT